MRCQNHECMNLIDQIIEELMDASKSLAGSLLKTKVLASRIKDQEIVDWADKEMAGYRGPDDQLPDYRHCRAVYWGIMQQRGIAMPEGPIPLMIFDDETKKRFFTPHIEQSVPAIESFINRGAEGGTIRKQYAADICQFLTTRIVNENKTGLRIVTLTSIIDVSEFIQVLSVIRAKLLDFMLKVESEVPALAKPQHQIQPLPAEEKSKVSNIFYSVINISGDNNTVAAGNQNDIK